MHVADNIERAVFGLSVVVKRFAGNDCGVYLFNRRETENMAKALARETAQVSSHLALLVSDDVRAEISIVTVAVAILANAFGKIEKYGDGQAMILPRKFDQRFACFGLYIGGVDYGKFSCGQSFRGDIVQHVERVIGRGLTVLVVANQPATFIRREDFGVEEMSRCECRFTRSGRADQDDQ